jgi:hypothetical protein
LELPSIDKNARSGKGIKAKHGKLRRQHQNTAILKTIDPNSVDKRKFESANGTLLHWEYQ